MLTPDSMQGREPEGSTHPLVSELRLLAKGSPSARALHSLVEDFCSQMKKDFEKQTSRHRSRGKAGAPNFTWNNRGEITTTFFKLMDSLKKWHAERPMGRKEDFRTVFATLSEVLLQKAGIPAESFGVKKFDTKVKDWEHGGTRYSSGASHTVKNVVVTEDYSLMLEDVVVDPAERKAVKKEGSEPTRSQQELQDLNRRAQLERQRHVDIKRIREKEKRLQANQISLEEMESRLRQMVGDKEGGLLHPDRHTDAFLDMFAQEKADPNFKIALLSCLFQSADSVHRQFEETGLVRRLRFWAKRYEHPGSPVECKLLQNILKVVAVVPLSYSSAVVINSGGLLNELAARGSNKLIRAFAAEALAHVKAVQERHQAAQPASQPVYAAASSSSSEDSDSNSSEASSSASSSSVQVTGASPNGPKARQDDRSLKPKPKSSPALPASKAQRKPAVLTPSPGDAPGGTKWFDLEAGQSPGRPAPTKKEPPAKRRRVSFQVDQMEVHLIEPEEAPAPQTTPWGERGPAPGGRPGRVLSLPMPVAPRRPRLPPRWSSTGGPGVASPGPSGPSSPPAPALDPPARPAPNLQRIISLAQAMAARQEAQLAATTPTEPVQLLPDRDPRLATPPPYSAPTLPATWRRLGLSAGPLPDSPAAGYVQAAVLQARAPKPYQCSTDEEYEEKMKEYQQQMEIYKAEMAHWEQQPGSAEKSEGRADPLGAASDP